MITGKRQGANVRFINSLPVKVAVAFLVVALVPLSIVSLFAMRTADQVIAGIVSNQLQGIAADKQALLVRWLGERRADLEVVAGADATRAGDPLVLGPYLKLMQDHYGVYRRFIVVDGTGRTTFDTAAEARHEYRDAAWFLASREGRRFLSAVRVGPHVHESVFDIAVPVVGRDGRPAGTVCATVSTTPILQSVLSVSLGETGECYLVDREGTFLVHREPRRILRDTIAGSGSFALVAGEQQPGRPYTDYRNIPVLGTARAVPDTDWCIVVEQDEAEAYAPSTALRRRLVSAIALTAAGAVGISLLLARSVALPIRRLSEAATAVAAGNFDHPAVHVAGRRRDEIGDLRSAFENMADQLRERQAILQASVDRTRTELEATDLRLQDTLAAAARSEHLAALGRLASSVAHEIRTPLASLKLYLQSIQEEVTLSPELSEDFDIAMLQVDRIEKTITRFLDYARPSPAARAELDIARLIDDAVLLVRHRAAHHDVTVDVAVAARLPRVVGDAVQIGEALVNLLVNAIDEMPRGGRLEITATREAPDDDDSQRSWLRLAVADAGPGVEPAVLDKLFEPFYTTKATGSGLGLAIVRGTIERHGGVVRVNSIPGAGATFSLYLPEEPIEGAPHG